MDDSLIKSSPATGKLIVLDENNNETKSNLITSKSLETGLNTKGILRSGSPNSRNFGKRKVFISPLFEVIPDAWEAKSIPSIPCPSPLRRCASPLSLFYRLSPSPSRGDSFFKRTFESQKGKSSSTSNLNSTNDIYSIGSLGNSTGNVGRKVKENKVVIGNNGGGGGNSKLFGANSLESVLCRVEQVSSSSSPSFSSSSSTSSSLQPPQPPRLPLNQSVTLSPSTGIKKKPIEIESVTNNTKRKVTFETVNKLPTLSSRSPSPSPSSLTLSSSSLHHQQIQPTKVTTVRSTVIRAPIKRKIRYPSGPNRSSSTAKEKPTTTTIVTKTMDSVFDHFTRTQASSRLEAQPVTTKIRETSSQNRVVIRQGKCVNADSMFDADIFIEDGIIKQIGPNLIVPGGCRVIDAKGHFVIPGGIDPHTHLEGSFMGAQSQDDFYAGTRAALAGGTTCIFDTPLDTNLSPIQLFEKYRAIADTKSCCDYGLHLAVTKWKDGSTDKELETLVRQKGVNSFKAFMAYKDTLMLEDHELIKLFDCCKKIGAVPKVHAENGHLIDFLAKKLLQMGVNGPEGHLQSRPEDLEAEAVHRASVLAHHVQCPLYIVHVMSKSAAEEVNRARSRGALVIGETLASAIGTDGIHYYNRCWQHAAGHVMSPPLRPDRTTPEGLVNALSAGVLDVVGSDHIVFSAQQKAAGKDNFTKIPNGVNGIEERLMVVWEKGVRTGKMDPTRFVAVTSANAAKIFNIYPRKGKIAVGSDADIVIWGKKSKVIKAETHKSRVNFNVFEGLQVEFSPIVVISQGVVVLDEDGSLHVSQGKGRYVECPPFPAILYERMRNRERNMGPVKVDRSERPETLRPAANPNASNGNNLISNNGSTATSAATSNSSSIKHNPISVEPPVISTKSNDFETIPTTGPPSPALSTASSGASGMNFHSSKTRSGVRNQQDSSFKLTGEQFDDSAKRTAIRVHNPPGGRSSGIF